ncbi:MAG: AAA family ATPase [Solirubrobacterales bacterium]|nr:AAA family ATPase [Solirubrobacterales bacterium]
MEVASPHVADLEAAAEARTVSTQQVDRAVTAGASHFDRHDAIQAVAGLFREGAPAADVERVADEFLASEAVLQIGEGAKGPRYTTQRIWELEQSALATAEQMRAEGPSPAGELVAARVLHAHPTLKDDQREMVKRLLTDTEGLSIVIGEAGTGKSYAIVTAAEGWAQAEMELHVAAPTWRAANVLRAEGLRATSVASLLGDLERAEQAREGLLTWRSVLLVDEAGMVDTATLSRLIHHVDQANAKLVLVGDPEQLGEIEAGGLFRALAERSDPIFLDEVIRHRHEADREAAKLIRAGEGTEALDLYRSEERVVVAPDAQARREAMVAEWHEAFDAGEDAVMVAKRNVEVERLNAMARALRQEAGQLGEREIEVGEARFAAGDLIITRVNDRAADIYNRERWQVAEVDAQERRVVLQGIDQPRTVEVDADYLARTNPHSDAPALEHAYAVTTYSAQGTTVDRAFLAADPSMDKQELYVAASRSRGETTIYAMPEIQVERDEFAPGDLYLREGIPHIAEASERDRAQRAAHDEALRCELRKQPTGELLSRRTEIRRDAGAEANADRRHADSQRWVGQMEEQLEHAVAMREAVEALPRKERRAEIGAALAREGSTREALAKGRAEVREQPPAASHQARAELPIAEQVLAERRQQAITAAKLAPPDYIVKELGERPSDPEKRKAWDRGVAGIEGYRQEHGITDRDSALGKEPLGGIERSAWNEQRSRLAEQQRTLQMQQEHSASHDLGQDFGHDMGIGM